MSDIPKYDPTKIVKRAYVKDINSSNLTESSADGEVPKYDASKIVKKGYAPREAFQEEGFVPDKYVSDGGYEDIESTLDFIQNKMPGLRDMRDDEKDILRDIMRNPKATKEDISSAIRTFKGVHAEQVYNKAGVGGTADYYMDMDDKGLYKPIPLGQNKPLPAGKNIASVWGTGGEETQDDSWYTDLSKKAFNIIPSAMEGVTDLFVAGSSELRKIGTAIEGKEYEKSTGTAAGEEAKKFFQQFKIPTSDEYNQSIYDAEGIKSFSDLISKDRVNLNLKNVYGTISNLAGSVAEMYLTGGAAAEGMLAKKALTGLSSAKGVAPALSKAEKYASVYTGTFISNLGEAMDAAKKAGISEEDAGGWAMAVTIPIAALDAGTGIGGKLLMNKLVNEGKKDFFGKMASKVVLDEFGNVTEESLKKASAEAAMAYAPVAKGFLSTVKLTGKDALVQGGEEAVQSFISSAGEQLYDKLSDADKVKFGTDAFSAESIGKYISEGVAGLVGAGPLAVKTAKIKQQENYKAQSNSAYETVMQGEDAVKAFKTNATNAFREGKISKEDYDNAILKVDSYDSYEKVSKDLTLDNENKKKLFELSLQKENLKAAIKFATEKDKEGKSRLDQMKPIELGLHNSKVEQADKIQKEIDLIVTKSEVLQQPEVAEKVVEKVVKAEEKATEGAKAKEGVSSEIGAILGRQYKVKTPVGGEVAVPGKAAYEVPKKVLEEKRKMKDFSTQEWNIANASVKQAKLADALEEVPEKTVEGTLQQDNKYQDKKTGLWVQTYNLTLPNGKTAQFASSMVRFPEEGAIGGFRGNTYEENLTDKKSPIGQKLGATVRTLKDSGRKVIFIWNADEGPKYGKHIGMVREDPEGKSVYGAADLDEMADLRMINMGQNPNAPAPGIFTPKEPTKGGPKVVVPIITTTMRKQLKGLKYSKADVQSMTPQEAADIIKEQREKPKPKTELKEVEIKDKKEATKANEAKRKAEVDAIIAEDKKKTGGGYTTRTAAAKIDEVNARYAALEKPTSTPTDLEALKQTPADIDRISKETEAKIKRKDLFIGVGDFSSELGGSDMAAVPVSHKEINGIEFVEYAHPKTGSIDVIVTGKSENDFVGFYRLYENGKPTNKWSSKFENQSRNKEDFKTMISGIQEMLPQGHEYTEKTSISTDGLRIWNQQLDRGYELQYDENGKLKTNLVAINGDAIVNDLGINVNKGEFENIKVKSKEEFEKVKKALLPYLQKFGLNENNIKWISGNIEITPTNEKAFGVTGTVKIDLPILKSTKQVTEKTKPTEEKGKVVVKKAPKEVVVEKEESIAKREALMESIKGASKLVAAYNNLTKVQKRSKVGVDLYKKIQDRVKEIGYTTTISRGGTLQLVGEKGKRVYKTPVKRTEDQKAMDEERKDALSAEATSIRHAVILSIANGRQFDVPSLEKYFPESVLKNEMPSLLKNNKNGIKVSSYKTSYEERFGQFEIENLTEADATREAAEALGDYFIDGFREAAIQDAIDINFKTKNEGRSRSEVEALNEMQREQDREEKELEEYRKEAEVILTEEELTKEEYRRQAEQEEGYLQKAKVKPATLNKFEKSVDLFYKTKDADGASKKRSLAAERREFLEKNPTVKYIDDNMKYIYKQLEEQNIIERKGECP